MKRRCCAGSCPQPSQRTWSPAKGEQGGKWLNYCKIRFQRVKTREEYGLTMRKQAPISTAFIFTSMSSGNWMPKLSVSVNTSFRRPLHCLLMRPMGLPPSFAFSCGARRATASVRICHSPLWCYFHRWKESSRQESACSGEDGVDHFDGLKRDQV